MLHVWCHVLFTACLHLPLFHCFSLWDLKLVLPCVVLTSYTWPRFIQFDHSLSWPLSISFEVFFHCLSKVYMTSWMVRFLWSNSLKKAFLTLLKRACSISLSLSIVVSLISFCSCFMLISLLTDFLIPLLLRCHRGWLFGIGACKKVRFEKVHTTYYDKASISILGDMQGSFPVRLALSTSRQVYSKKSYLRLIRAMNENRVCICCLVDSNIWNNSSLLWLVTLVDHRLRNWALLRLYPLCLFL